MRIQVRRFAIVFAIAAPLATAATAKSSAAPINGRSIKAAAPAVTTDVRYRHPDYPQPSYWAYPAYSSNEGYPTDNSYWDYPTYNSYPGYPTFYYSYPSYGWW